MGQRTPTVGIEPGVATLLAQVDTICALLREASGEPFRVVADGEQPAEPTTALAPGWSLAGCVDTQRREAAAELLGRVLSAEQEIESLCTEILDRYEEVTLIQRLGLEMARTADEDGLAGVLVREITDWLHARAGEIWLRDGGSLRLAGGLPGERHPDGQLVERGPLEALSEGSSWKQDAVGGVEAVVAVALPAERGDSLGVLVVRGKEGNRSFDQREIQLLTAVAALASGFLRSHRLARESWRCEHEGSASDLCRMVRPQRETGCRGLEISCACLDGRQPGSDHHDVVQTPDGGVAVNLARISTGGTRAIAHMALAKGVLQAEARSGSSPDGMLRRLNEVLTPELIRSDLFATASVAQFRPGGRRVDFASAGHAAPLLVRAGCGTEEIDVAGPALGLLDVADYGQCNRVLEPGDLLLFYSDGFLDARNPEGHALDLGFVGELISSVRGATAEQYRDRLLGALDSHCDGRSLEYDATVVVARVV